MSLVNELIKGLLPEEEKKKVVAVYGGGFKPPTSGHFAVVKQALKENPEIDEFIILIGGKPRNGITPDESILIWDIYKQYLPFKVEVKYTSVPPIKGIYNYAKDHPDEEVLFIIGAREGNEEDFKDIASRTTTLDKYPNLNLRTIVTQGGVSGTAARNASKISLDKFKPFVPTELSDEEVEQVYNIVADKITEGRKKKKNPKKGTGKKPEGSKRRLYTDEDPKDTVGIKFSTRQDIVDTLNKTSFKAKSHARQSQIINLIHQRVRAAYGRAKDPAVKKRLKTGLDYITDKKEASKKKTQRLKKLKEGDTYEKMAAKGKKAGSLKQGTVRKRLNIPKDKKIPLSLINKEIARLKKMDKDPDKKGAQLGDKNQKYYKALQLAKTLKTTTNVNEEITKSQLNSIEAYADKLFAKLGIDIEFTKHFLDRVNDERNKKPITVPELIGMFKRLHRKHGKPLSKVDNDFDAVVKDFNNNINIPFAINVTPNDIDLVAKTVMRKKDFKTSTPVIALNEDLDAKPGNKMSFEEKLDYYKNYYINVSPSTFDIITEDGNIIIGGLDKPYPKGFNDVDDTRQVPVNENASYSKEINIKEKIAQLTRHMIDKGMNIEPLPSLKFVDGDSENAKDFFGKTAYYDPNTQTVVLYTEGRHPKDIVRSYAHEMIHHIQYLEDRLGNVSTTNTTEDDHLDKIEQEANLKGTMTFRNWTDSILNEAIVGEKIKCDNCGWSWNIVDGGDDLFICHKCGHDNESLNEVKPYKHKHGFNDKLGKDPFGLNQFAREIAEEVISEGRYDRSTNQFSKIAFEAFKDIHDSGDKEGTFEFSVGPFEEDIYSEQFEFDFEGKVEITDNEYNVNGGANQGFDEKGDEITPLLNLDFKIPKNPDWQEISFDIKDVIRHELEHLTQGGLNLKGGAWDEDPKLRRPSKQMADDQLVRDLIDIDMLPKSQYYKLEKEVDAMLQGLYFKAKKSKRPFKDVIDDYLDIFVNNKTISLKDKKDILDLWRSRGKALSLPIFENQKQDMDYKIYSDMDGVLVDFEKGYEKLTGIDLKGEYRPDGKDFWKPIEQAGVGYWAGLKWMSDGKKLWNYIKPYTPKLLSAPSRDDSSKIGKYVWVKQKLPGTKLILRYASQKQELATPESILIDDRQVNIDQWEAAGGIGILHTSADNTIKQLKQLGL